MDINIIAPAIEPALGVDDLAPPTGSADPETAARFSDLMEVQETDGAAPERVGAVDTASPAHPRTLGDQILGGLQHVSTELQQTWESVSSALDGAGKDLGLRDMLKLQLGLSKMSVNFELVGKVVSRSTQNIDQLVKLQ